MGHGELTSIIMVTVTRGDAQSEGWGRGMVLDALGPRIRGNVGRDGLRSEVFLGHGGGGWYW